jgi:hypothetical protein
VIQTVLLLLFLWSGLSIGRFLILPGKTTDGREKVPSASWDQPALASLKTFNITQKA